MKKKLVATILGLAAATAVFNAGNVANAQGQIFLDNYYSFAAGPSYALVTYGAGSSGALGAPVTGGFTAGIYMSASPFVFEGATTQAGANTSALPGAQSVAANSTAPIGALGAGFYSATSFLTTPAAVGQPVYFVVLAYNGANYNDSTVRGHSAVYQLNTASAPPIAGTGSFGSSASFSVAAVAPIPEPSTFALAGLGLASLLIFRRRK